MAIMVRNIALPLEGGLEDMLAAVAKRLRVSREAIRTYAVVHRSIDARKHRPLRFNFHVEVGLHESHKQERRRVLRLHRNDVRFITPAGHPDPQPGTEPLQCRPVVIGFGPAGMFAALRLARHGYQPLVLERGQDIRHRHHDVLKRFIKEKAFNPESNYLFGEGGAGAYSDGKLYTRLSDPLVRTVLEVLYHHGADPDILVDAHPHIGSDMLPGICRRIRRHIERLGGEVRFQHRVDKVVIEDNRLVSLRVNEEFLAVGPTILAIGISARDTVRMLSRQGVTMVPRPFQVGVRIEHPQEMVNRWQYGGAAGHEALPPAEYRLVAKGAAGGRGDLFSFCMCPGGTILPTNESPTCISVNGASRSGRGGLFANAGLIITVEPAAASTNVLAGVEYLERLERQAFVLGGGDYRAPAMRAVDFLANRRSGGRYEGSYPFGVTWCDAAELLPCEVVQALETGLQILDKRMPGFGGGEAVMLAPETRASCPLRILRHSESREAVATRNLYPTGDGAGYAGGIVSAAIDGIKTADAIIARYAP
ncbi:MAG: FAD-dependent oxidoreductase [Phycisphaerae bacterium]|nr:FAD-dependent oxidoreductase [Phycisphaerae bacterium]